MPQLVNDARLDRIEDYLKAGGHLADESAWDLINALREAVDVARALYSDLDEIPAKKLWLRKYDWLNGDEGWRVANDTPIWYRPRRTVYFLIRWVGGKRVDLEDKNGKLRTWSSREKAEAVCKRLNSAAG